MTIIRTASRRLAETRRISSVACNRLSPPTQKLLEGVETFHNTIGSDSDERGNNFVSHKYVGSRQTRTFKTRSFQTTSTGNPSKSKRKPGSMAFAECETNAIQDLFFQFANEGAGGGGVDEDGTYLNIEGVRELLSSIGERPDNVTLANLFKDMDQNNNGKLHLDVSACTFFTSCYVYAYFL